MRRINFSDVGVVVNSMEELDEIYLTCTALGILFVDSFKDSCIKAQQHNLVGWFIQTTRADLETTLDGYDLELSLVSYPIRYSMSSLDFAIACQLLQSNKTDALIAHLDKHCKEYK